MTSAQKCLVIKNARLMNLFKIKKMKIELIKVLAATTFSSQRVQILIDRAPGTAY